MQPDTAMARGWHALQLGDTLMAFLPLADIVTAVRAASEAPGAPPGIVAFTRHDQDGGLHCRVTVYFPPAAAGIAAQFDAEPCRRPARAGLGLLAGDERSLERLFAEWPREDHS